MATGQADDETKTGQQVPRQLGWHQQMDQGAALQDIMPLTKDNYQSRQSLIDGT